MTYLVSLLSEHLLPNFLLAKEFVGQYNRHVFITTKRMDENGITARYCNALGIEEGDVEVVFISEDNLTEKTMSKL